MRGMEEKRSIRDMEQTQRSDDGTHWLMKIADEPFTQPFTNKPNPKEKIRIAAFMIPGEPCGSVINASDGE